MTLLPRLAVILGATALAAGFVASGLSAGDRAGALRSGVFAAVVTSDASRSPARHDAARDATEVGAGATGHARLPAECRVYGEHRSGYSDRCLHHYFDGNAALPTVCAVQVGGHHGTIYRGTCLKRFGFN